LPQRSLSGPSLFNNSIDYLAHFSRTLNQVLLRIDGKGLFGYQHCSILHTSFPTPQRPLHLIIPHGMVLIPTLYSYIEELPVRRRQNLITEKKKKTSGVENRLKQIRKF